jgi:hydroxymethylbilane synthase
VSRTIYIATRGSALALAQSNMVLAECRRNFPDRNFELKIIKTTGDKLQTVNLANVDQTVTKGLFTKELEVAMLNREADFAVHSLKDLPTELPEGLYLSAVSKREDVRDVLLYRSLEIAIAGKRGYRPGTQLMNFPATATIATSSTRRQAQILAVRPDLKTVPIRGNVGTRMQKLLGKAELDGTVLALAGMKRLGYTITPEGPIEGNDVPRGLLASILPLDQMLPCVGQAALGFESRIGDKETDEICAALNHQPTFHCVTAERAFLRSMGGGCLSPIAAYAEFDGHRLRIRAVSFKNEKVRRGELSGPSSEASALGTQLAQELS